MVMSWRKCILIVTLLNVFILVRSSMLNGSNSKDSSSSKVISVFRGLYRSPDRLNVCSQEIEAIEKFIARVQQGSDVMNCSMNVTRCSSREKPGLVGTHCSCKSQSPTYIASKQSCVSNGWLRRGCAFRFGSWRFRNGWSWIDWDKPLLSLYIDDGYGITGGFNASTKKYESCSLVNISILNQFGSWEMHDYDPTSISFFKLLGYFHISWLTKEMKLEDKQKLRGKLGRFLVNCETPIVVIEGDSVKEEMLSSCLPFKVTGNLTYEHSFMENSKEGSGSTKTVAIVLGVVFPLLFIIAGLSFAIWFYRRRSDNNCELPFLRNCWREN